MIEATRTVALLWAANAAAPAVVAALAVRAQAGGASDFADLAASQQLAAGAATQALQLAATAALLRAAAAPHAPLPAPWFSYRAGDARAVLVAVAAAAAAAGSGALLATALGGAGSGSAAAGGGGEMGRMLAEGGVPGAALLALNVVALAPASEELMFRGFVLPVLTRWMSPAAAVRNAGGPA